MQSVAVTASSTRWAGRGWRCPRHPAPGLGAGMAATVVRASGGPSPPISACARGWVGACALSGESPIMPFASLVLATSGPPNATSCCLLLMQLLICVAIHNSGSALAMGGTAIGDSNADKQLHQQQARCPARAVPAADWAARYDVFSRNQGVTTKSRETNSPPWKLIQ